MRSARDNRPELRGLLERGQLDLSPAPLLWETVDRVAIDVDRVEGMLLGVAVGDALGNPTESVLPATRHACYGEVRDYQRTHHGVAVPSDDTQMTFWTLEHVLEHDGLDPDLLARRFAAEPIFGSGHAVREFVIAIHAGAPWVAAAPHSAGNGALMRIAPVLIPHLATGGALWADAALAAAVTHNDSASISACVSFVSLLRQAITLKRAPHPMWWIDEYVRVAAQLETERRYRPRTCTLDFEGTLSQFVDTEVRAAVQNTLSARAACDRWYSGAYLLETVPSVLQILALHAHDPEEAIVRAINDTKDNDTIGAIVGAAVGALHGRHALPQRWLSQLSGRIGAHDDGHIFELITAMRDHLTTRASQPDTRVAVATDLIDLPRPITAFLVETVERMMSIGNHDPIGAVDRLPVSMPAGQVLRLAGGGPFGWLLDARVDRIEDRVALEVCEDNRMSGPRHYIVWDDGSVEELATEQTSIVFPPDCSDEERERLQNEYVAHNRAVHDLLTNRGFR